MRAPGGISGKSWMQAAAEDTPLARLWLERQQTTTTFETAMDFAAMGEQRAAAETLLAVAARQVRGFAAMADDPDYPPHLRHLVWSEWAAEPGGRARAEAEIAALMPGDPQIVRFQDRPVTPAERDAWLAVAPLAEPLRATCAAACPASVADLHPRGLPARRRSRDARQVRHAVRDADPARGLERESTRPACPAAGDPSAPPVRGRARRCRCRRGPVPGRCARRRDSALPAVRQLPPIVTIR